jgi:hypothetical protein
MDISKELREQLLVYQRNEITEHHVYKRLAGTIRSPENKRVLENGTIRVGETTRNRMSNPTN